MKKVTKDQFYEKLMAEKRDIISAYTEGGQREQFYPLTSELFERSNRKNVFGKIRALGYINGVPVTEYFLND